MVHFACEDLNPKQRFVIYPGDEKFPMAGGIEAIGLRGLGQLLQDLG